MESQRNGFPAATSGYAGDMLGVIFHFWLGLLLAIVGGLAVVSLIAGYVKQVVSPQYPSKRHRRDD